MMKKLTAIIATLILALALITPSSAAMDTTTNYGFPTPTYGYPAGESSANEFIAAMDAADAALKSALDGKAPVPVTVNIASNATPTPAIGTVGADIHYNITALAEAATFGVPTGTPVAGQRLIISILDNGTARALDFTNAAYRAVGPIKPTTTVVSKYLYVSLIYNATDAKWHMVGVNQEQ